MRLIALVSVALAVSTSALPRVVLGRDLGHNARGAGGLKGGLEKKQANNGCNPQTSLGKCNGYSLTSRRLCRPSSVGSRGHLHQI
jgi:hypothetical protein